MRFRCPLRGIHRYLHSSKNQWHSTINSLCWFTASGYQGWNEFPDRLGLLTAIGWFVNTGKGWVFCLLKPFTLLSHRWGGLSLQWNTFSSILTLGKQEHSVEGGPMALQPKNYKEWLKGKKKQKHLPSSRWVTVFIPAVLSTPFTRNFWIHTFPLFAVGFLLTYKGKGHQCGATWQFQKGISFFPINFCTMQFEVDRHCAEQSHQRGSCSWNVLNAHSLDAGKRWLPPYWHLPIFSGLAASVGHRYYFEILSEFPSS